MTIYTSPSLWYNSIKRSIPNVRFLFKLCKTTTWFYKWWNTVWATLEPKDQSTKSHSGFRKRQAKKNDIWYNSILTHSIGNHWHLHWGSSVHLLLLRRQRYVLQQENSWNSSHFVWPQQSRQAYHRGNSHRQGGYSTNAGWKMIYKMWTVLLFLNYYRKWHTPCQHS